MTTFEISYTCAATLFIVAFVVYNVIDVMLWCFDIGQ